MIGETTIAQQMLHHNFRLLVDFVEVDCADQWRVYNRKIDAAGERERRSREEGLAHLDSMIRSTVTAAPDTADRDFGDAYLWQETFIADESGYVSLATQAWMHAAREMKQLYLWYTGQRLPAGENDDREDQAMLIRLMKIRLYLWM